MRILFASANSPDAYLDIEREHREWLSIARDGKHSLKILPGAERADLAAALSPKDDEKPFDVFHFAGHATKDEGIALRGPGKSVDHVTGKDLKGLLEKSGVKLAVLNACESQGHAREISEVVPAIGTTSKVADWAARKFTKGFYEGLNTKLGVDAAFDAATKKTKTYTRFPEGSFDIEFPVSAQDTAQIDGEGDFYRWFYSGYIDRQIASEKHAIYLGNVIFWLSLGVVTAATLYYLRVEGAALLTNDDASAALLQTLNSEGYTASSRDPGWLFEIRTAVLKRWSDLWNGELQVWQRVRAIDKAIPELVMLCQTRIGPLFRPATNSRIQGLENVRGLVENWETIEDADREMIRNAVHNSLKESLTSRQSQSLIESFKLTFDFSIGPKESKSE